MSGRYSEFYEQSINDPEIFWGKAAEEVQWVKKWESGGSYL